MKVSYKDRSVGERNCTQGWTEYETTETVGIDSGTEETDHGHHRELTTLKDSKWVTIICRRNIIKSQDPGLLKERERGSALSKTKMGESLRFIETDTECPTSQRTMTWSFPRRNIPSCQTLHLPQNTDTRVVPERR